MFRSFSRLFMVSAAVLLLQAGDGLAADSKPSGSQDQIEVMIIHVDKYGVYGPKLVFYWDTGMSKQKIDALMRTAEQLRNKRATVVYSASGELAKDKRPLLVDIVPLRDEQKPGGSERKHAAKEERKPASREEIRQGSGEALAVDELRDENASEEKSVQSPPAKPRKVEQAVQGTPGDASGPQKTALTAAQRQPAYPEQKPPRSSAYSTALTKEEIGLFIQKLLRLNETKDLNAVMSCYADQVNYYDRGVVNRDYIRRDMGYYYRNWTVISSAMDGDPVLIVTDQQDMRIVKFVSRYSVQNSKKSVTGRVENLWKIQKIDNELKIVDQKQRILSSETR